MKKQLPLYLLCGLFGYFIAGPDLIVEGFSQLGTDAPKIKMMKLADTTSDTQGDDFYLDLGITSGQVLFWKVQINNTSDEAVESNYVSKRYDGYEYYSWLADDRLYIEFSDSNSFEILEKPWEAIIFYEE